jgi:hypothetical protein
LLLDPIHEVTMKNVSYLGLLFPALLLGACAGSPANESSVSSEAAETSESLDAVQHAIVERLPEATNLTNVQNGFGGHSYGFELKGVHYMSWQTKKSDGTFEWSLFELGGTQDGQDSIVMPLDDLASAALHVGELIDRLEQQLGAPIGTPSIAIRLGKVVPGLTFARFETRQVQHLAIAHGQPSQPGPLRDTSVMVLTKDGAEYVFFTRDAGTGGPHRIMTFAKASDWDGVAVAPMTACAGTAWLAGVDTPGYHLANLVDSYTRQCGAFGA